jgi:hypothetical protein
MTQVIIDDILPLTQAIASGGQTVYSTNWTANAASDVVVYSRASGVAANDVTQKLSSSQYTVAFIGGSLTVQVTLVTPSTAGDMVTILRQTPANRENLYTNTNFTPSMINNDVGILTLVDQQSQLVNSQVGPRYNYSEFLTIPNDTILPILGANQLWIKNPTNTAIIAATISGGGSGGGVNPGLQNQVAWYATNGNVVSGLPTLANGILTTNSLGVPSISNTIPSNSVVDSNGNIILSYPQPAIANAVNHFFILNNSTGNPVTVGTVGADAAVPLSFGIKGGLINIYDTSLTNSAKLRFYNAANNHFIGLSIPTAQSSSLDFILPPADGTANAPLITDGAGNWSFLPGAWIDFSGTIGATGFTGALTINVARWKQIGKTVFVSIYLSGTSNATSFTITNLPVAVNASNNNFIGFQFCQDNTANSICSGAVSGTTLTLYNTTGSLATGWTNSGTKGFSGIFSYEAA